MFSMYLKPEKGRASPYTVFIRLNALGGYYIFGTLRGGSYSSLGVY